MTSKETSLSPAPPDEASPSPSSSQGGHDGRSATPEYNHHTYHIPNHYSRRALSGSSGGKAKSGLYQPLKQHDEDEEGVAVEDEEVEGNVGQPDEADGSDTPAWALLVVFALLGAAVLLPFNTLVTPTEFYRNLFSADHARSEGFLSWVLLVYNVASITLGAHATVSLARTTPPRRIFLAASTVLVCLLLLCLATSTTVADSVVSSNGGAPIHRPLWYFGLLLGVAFIAGSASYLQNAVVALCSIFGGQAMGLMLSGQGIVGAIIAVVQLVAAYRAGRSAGAGKAEEDKAAAARAATALFAFATAFMALALAGFAWLVRTQRFKQVYSGYEAAKRRAATQDTEEGPQAAAEDETLAARYTQDHGHGLAEKLIHRLLPATTRRGALDLLTVQRKVSLLSFAVFYIYVVTLCVYPAVTAKVTSTAGEAGATPLVFIAWHLVCFNVSDVVGRTLPSVTGPLMRSPKVIVAATLARTIFVPAFLACNVRSSSGTAGVGMVGPLPDWLFFLLVLIFGLSNGLLSTSIFVCISEHEEGQRSGQSMSMLGLDDDSQRASAGAILSFWLTIGLAVGSALSFGVVGLAG